MKDHITIIEPRIKYQDSSKVLPVKSNWKLDLVKKGLQTLQHVSPRKTSEIIWKQYTRPGKPKFTSAQKALIDRAQISYSSYLGHKVVHYRWGNTGPKVLMCHGWQSKIADFRKIIEALVNNGFIVEGIDMKAHGQSEGKYSALPEFRDILKNHYVKTGDYHAVIGYSLGGLAAGTMLSEVTPTLHPKHLVFISSPPFVRYFFRDSIRQFGFTDEVYEEMCDLIEKYYNQQVDYFDLRNKSNDLPSTSIHLIYDEDDPVVPFRRGKELGESLPATSFTQTRGLGHFKILTEPEVIKQIVEKIKH